MRLRLRQTSAAIAAGILAGALFAPAGAQDPKPVAKPKGESKARAAQEGQPVTVPGFAYERLDGGANSSPVHMNTCEAKACTPGSKVSYRIYASNPQHSFDAFREGREKLEATMRQRLPAAIILRFDPPTTETVGDVTIYESRRHQSEGVGRDFLVVSRTLFARKATIELISSSADPRAAELNVGAWQLPILLWLGLDADGKAKSGARQ